jgi:alcohol dehydrogenase YqhD (iron-dependent ADH family)
VALGRDQDNILILGYLLYKKQEENKIDITKSFEFQLPTRVLFRVNQVDSLGEEVKALGVQRLLLVTDRGVVDAGLRERVTRVLEAADLDYTIFDAVEANPTTTLLTAVQMRTPLCPFHFD